MLVAIYGTKLTLYIILSETQHFRGLDLPKLGISNHGTNLSVSDSQWAGPFRNRMPETTALSSLEVFLMLVD
jgi:hypothetical protein